MTGKAFNEALVAWRKVLSNECVIVGERSQSKYGPSTLGENERIIAAALLPSNVEEVIAIVEIAAQHSIPLYPISTGINWGFGSASPVVDNCVVLDLSLINRIIQFDEDLGIIEVEPGTTFGDLAEFLKKKKSRFIAPASGPGPSASLIGHVLEKGICNGFNSQDRLATLLSIKAVLADGTRYSSSNVINGNAPPYYKWGVGPYLDGLFIQSNLGIVVSATFSLSLRPETASAFFFNVKRNASLGELTEKIREMNLELGGIVALLAIQNADRTFLDLFETLEKGRSVEGLTDNSFIQDQITQRSLSSWVVFGVLAGKEEVVKSAEKLVCKKFSTFTNKVWVFGQNSLETLLSIRERLPQSWRLKLYFLVMMQTNLEATLGNLILRSASSNRKPESGFFIFMVAVPMKRKVLEHFIRRAEEICTTHNFHIPLRFSKLNEKTYHASLAILFDKKDKQETARARQCYEDLYKMSREEGVLPYRVGIDAMKLLFDSNKTFWETAGKIKKALDPNNIISPGRYSDFTN